MKIKSHHFSETRSDSSHRAPLKLKMRMSLAFTKLCAAIVLTTATVGSVHGGSLFWAINQYTTIQQLNGDNGTVVQFFAVPANLGHNTGAASIAVVGNVGYYTRLGDANVFIVDMTTHLRSGPGSHSVRAIPLG
jgi:hypothetical protein